MSYLGNTPTTALYAAKTDVYSGDGSTVNFTLTREVTNTQDLEVLVNNVQQSTVSGDAYTVSGTTLTFTEAPSSGTNNILVTYRNNVITRVIPSDDTISAVMLQANSVTGPKLGLTAINANNIVDGTITGVKIATGTITGDDLAANIIRANNVVANTLGSNTLTTTGVSAGNYGGTSNIPVITVDTAGRLSYAANVALSLNNVTGDLTVSGKARVGNTTIIANTTFDVFGGVSMNVVTLATSSNTINVALANYFVHSPAGTTTYVFEGTPTTRDVSFVIELTNGGTYTINWPAAVKWPANTAPTLTSSGKDLVIFSTANTGSTWRGSTLIGYTG